MPEMSRRDLAVTGGAAIVIVAGVEVGLLGASHIVGLLLAYAVVSVASVAFGRGADPPAESRKAAVVIATFLAAAVPLAASATPPAGAEWRLLRTATLAGGWAIPIALTVALGVFEDDRRRRAVGIAHAVAVVALFGSATVAFEGATGQVPVDPVVAAGAYYAVGVVVGYPAVLSYRRGLESA